MFPRCYYGPQTLVPSAGPPLDSFEWYMGPTPGSSIRSVGGPDSDRQHLMDWGIYFKFPLMNPSLLFALLTILLMCGFQERLFDMSMLRCVATGTALSVSSCMLYELSMGDFDLVMCITSHLEGLKVICQDCF